MKKMAIIVAGGVGSRMGATIPKQFLLLNDQPILWHTLRVFALSYSDMEMIVVLPEAYLSAGKEMAKDFTHTHKIHFVAGGETRFHSVKNGLKLVQENAILFIHDAVRCMLSQQLIQSCFTQAQEKGSAIPAIAATDSIRIVEGKKNKLLNRNNVRIIQTPQTFRSNILLPAFEQPYQDSFTDEASVVEAFGQEVFLIEGEDRNIKITRPLDLLLAQEMIAGKVK